MMFRVVICGLCLLLFWLPPAAPSRAQVSAQDLFYEGFELLRAGKAAEAVGKFRSGLKAEPDNATARFYLAEALLATGESDLARREYTAVVNLEPHGEWAQRSKARLSEIEAARPRQQKTASTDARSVKDCPRCPTMVVIPAGQIVIGSPPSEAGRDDDEGPPRIVNVRAPFLVGLYEITFDEWQACVADRNCDPVADNGWGRGSRPVINVTFDQTQRYLRWLSKAAGKPYRLLSEAEWEYVARSGATGPWYWGSKAGDACRYANVFDVRARDTFGGFAQHFACDDGFAGTAPVGRFRANRLGVHDMLGNVWEWVQDCYGSYQGLSASADARDSRDCAPRVIRGGSWQSTASSLRAANRGYLMPGANSEEVGFRVARASR